MFAGVPGKPRPVPEHEREGGDRLPLGEEHRDRAQERPTAPRREAKVEGEQDMAVTFREWQKCHNQA